MSQPPLTVPTVEAKNPLGLGGSTVWLCTVKYNPPVMDSSLQHTTDFHHVTVFNVKPCTYDLRRITTIPFEFMAT